MGLPLPAPPDPKASSIRHRIPPESVLHEAQNPARKCPHETQAPPKNVFREAQPSSPKAVFHDAQPLTRKRPPQTTPHDVLQ